MISICIIVKNEAKNLTMCLERIVRYGYEIIVVDTGSTDESKEIAGMYTKDVYDFIWCDDFSAARNYAISKATFDYIWMLDSDEFITHFEQMEVENLVKNNPDKVARITRNNIFDRDESDFVGMEFVNRIFNKTYYHYEGRIHEQIVSLHNKEYETYEVPICIDHCGYNGDTQERKKKAERNIRLLLEVLEEDGDEPYILYQLGKSYYMKKEYEEAVTYFERTFVFDLNPRLEYVMDLVETYGYALLKTNLKEKALQLINIYDEFSQSADFVFMMGNVYLENGYFEQAIEQFIKATTFQESKLAGVNSYLAYYNIGVIKECLGDKKQAMEYYEKCGEYENAKNGILRCL